MKATNCDRYGCTMGGRRIKYAQLRNYVCDECGGQAVHRFLGLGVDEVICGACGAREFVHEMAYAQQCAEAYEVERGLPEYLRAQLKGEPQCQSVTDAIADLFD